MGIQTRHRTIVKFVVLSAMCIVAFENCDVSRPSVTDGSSGTVQYIHGLNLQSCSSCHESGRPAVSGTGVLHGNNADCVACHASSNDLSVPLQTTFNNNATAYTHPGTNPTSCANCHANNRPTPVNNFPHFNNQDCASCHVPNGNNSDGLTLTQITDAFYNNAAYTHPTNLTSCSQCHAPLRPTPTQDPGHDQTQDCISCHNTNDTWTQNMTNTQIQSLWSAGSH